MKNNAYYFEGIRSNDNKVVGHFIGKCKPMMAKLAQQFPSLSAEDIFQEAIVVVLRKIKEGSLKEDQMSASLSTYLYSVAQNQCRDKMKKKRPEALKEGYDMPAADNDHEELYAERLSHVRDLAALVKPPCNGIIYDYYINRVSYQDIAVKYGYKNANSAKKKNGECLKKARNLVGENKSLKKIFYNYAY